MPQEISYQGVLTNGAGTAIPDGNGSTQAAIDFKFNGISEAGIRKAGSGGGILGIKDESYNSDVDLEADGSTGGGGVIMVKRNDLGNTGFEVNGNFFNSTEPYIAIAGSVRSAVMRMDVNGDASVRSTL